MQQLLLHISKHDSFSSAPSTQPNTDRVHTHTCCLLEVQHAARCRTNQHLISRLPQLPGPAEARTHLGRKALADLTSYGKYFFSLMYPVIVLVLAISLFSDVS